MSEVIFIYVIHVGHNTLADHGWRLDPQGSGGPPSTFFSVDGGHSQIYSSDTSQGARRRRFLALMVGAPGSPAPASPRGPVVDIS
jgi:hypothetical protein